MGKKALVVGINAYAPPNALPSCVHDADAFSDLLRSAYRFDAVTDLRDAQATRAGIIDALKGLVAQSGALDELVFYYSGHGYSWQDGDTQIDSLVGQDAQFLTSQDFSAATAAAPPGILTVVLDSCFSGGMMKAFALVTGVKPALVKFFKPTVEHKAFDPALPAIRVLKDFGAPMGGGDPSVLLGPKPDAKAFSLVDPAGQGVERRFILVSACRGDETAAASTDRTNGFSAFTFCFLQQIAAGGRNHGMSRLLDQAGQALRGLGVTQTPMLKVPAVPAGLADHAFLLWDAPVPELQGSPQAALADIPPTAKPNGKGSPMTTSFDLNSDIRSIVLATSPGVAASLNGGAQKGLDFSASNGVDKGWFDDLTRVVATVIPAVVQGMKTMPAPTKGFDTAPQPFDKGWFDDVVHIASAVVPQIVASLKSPAPGTAVANSDLSAAAQKGWFDDVTHVVANVLPVVLQAMKSMPAGSAKGFQPNGTTTQPVDEKSFWSTLGHIASVAVPIALAAL